MAIIPAERHNAAWNVSHQLNDLLGWARYPDPNALSEAFAEAYTSETLSGRQMRQFFRLQAMHGRFRN